MVSGVRARPSRLRLLRSFRVNSFVIHSSVHFVALTRCAPCSPDGLDGQADSAAAQELLGDDRTFVENVHRWLLARFLGRFQESWSTVRGLTERCYCQHISHLRAKELYRLLFIIRHSFAER